METNKHIQDKIDSTFEVIDAIEKVNVSPFFKDKTMNVLFTETEQKQTAWNWFTPKVQFATLVCVVVLNVIAFTKLEDSSSSSSSSSYDESLSEFAESYGLSTSDDDTSILN